MNQLLNFNDTLIVAQHNWWLVLLALALGVWLGWTITTYEPREH
jgi:hypothetical protein